MRTILHSDCNNFYASVECVYDKALRGKPLAVCGSQEARHGIVLAKSEQAKKMGVKTGEAIWQARRKCPELIIVTPHFDRYLAFSKRMQEIYLDYTDRVEPFGLDECWLDLTGCPMGGLETAAEIRRRAKNELGITVSAGVSFNKVFAKLGSDLHKPDATTVITEQNFKEKIWPLPAGELLFVGRATLKTLAAHGLNTIGDVARARPEVMRRLLGKGGDTLWRYAAGTDDSPVTPYGFEPPPRSIGNSTTLPRDLNTPQEARIVLYSLAEGVSARLRAEKYRAGTVVLWVRDSALSSYERQMRLKTPSDLAPDLLEAVFFLFTSSYKWQKPIRSLGLRATCLTDQPPADNLFSQETARAETLARTIDHLREKYGGHILTRGVLMTDPSLFAYSATTNALPPPIPD